MNFYFYKKAWVVLKDDIIAAFDKFYSIGKLENGLNSLFLVLVPKVDGFSSLADFKPISLLNDFYKLLAKVLSIHLRAVWPFVIAQNQQAFIRGKSLLDCAMIAIKVVHT